MHRKQEENSVQNEEWGKMWLQSNQEVITLDKDPEYPQSAKWFSIHIKGWNPDLWVGKMSSIIYFWLIASPPCFSNKVFLKSGSTDEVEDKAPKKGKYEKKTQAICQRQGGSFLHACHKEQASLLVHGMLSQWVRVMYGCVIKMHAALCLLISISLQPLAVKQNTLILSE